MKKLISLLTVAILCFCLLVPVVLRTAENKSEKITVCSFCGENEQFAVTNGVIVISADEEIFYGGDLITDDEYSLMCHFLLRTRFTATNGETRTIIL